jgi:type IV secretion system protein VirD4
VGIFDRIGKAVFGAELAPPAPPPPPAAPPVPPRAYTREQTPFGDAGWMLREEVISNSKLTAPLDAEANAAHWDASIYLGRLVNIEYQPGLNAIYTPSPASDLAAYGDPYNQEIQLGFSGETNIVTFSSAGGGKNAAAIIPTLLVNAQSMFVNDMKGENFFVSSWYRQVRMGHRIVCLNPFNLFGKELGLSVPMTHHFNPLGGLHPDSPTFVSHINTLADALIVSEGKDPHWTTRARQLVAGVMARLCFAPAATLVDGTVIESSLPGMFRVMSLDMAELILFCQKAIEQCSHPIVRDNLASFATVSNENGGIRSTAVGQLGFLAEPALRDFLAYSDFDFSDMRKERVTVYCMIPPALMDTYYRFARVLVQSCFNALSNSPPTERAPVLMLLDEQAKLGGMDIIRSSAATLRGYNVRIWSVFQDLPQLQAIFPDYWESFIGNAGVTQVMTVNDAVTAEYFSKKTGMRGVRVQSSSSTYTAAEHVYGATSRTDNESWQQVPCFSPQDFYGMPRSRQVLFLQGQRHPIYAERLGYHELEPTTQEPHPLNLQGEAIPNPYYITPSDQLPEFFAHMAHNNVAQNLYPVIYPWRKAQAEAAARTGQPAAPPSPLP